MRLIDNIAGFNSKSKILKSSIAIMAVVESASVVVLTDSYNSTCLKNRYGARVIPVKVSNKQVPLREYEFEHVRVEDLPYLNDTSEKVQSVTYLNICRKYYGKYVCIHV